MKNRKSPESLKNYFRHRYTLCFDINHGVFTCAFNPFASKLFQRAPSPSDFPLLNYFWIYFTCGFDVRDLEFIWVKLFDWLAAYSATEKLNSFQLFRAELQRFRWRTIYCLNNSHSAPRGIFRLVENRLYLNSILPLKIKIVHIT